MVDKSTRDIITALSISIIGHILALYLTPPVKYSQIPDQIAKKNTEIFKITKIIPAIKKNKLRTIGIKNGKKEFSIPITNGNRPKKFTLKDLSKFSKIQKFDRPNKNADKHVKITKYPRRKKSNNQRDELLSSQVLKQLSPQDLRTIKSVGLNNIDIRFEKPEGVKESELNSLEKILYSFKKRSYVAYVNSFVHSYNEILLERPYLKNHFNSTNNKHSMLGKITFDALGNIVTIKFMKTSTDDHLQALFENTLKGIKALYNPPSTLIKKGDNFHIYYQLIING